MIHAHYRKPISKRRLKRTPLRIMRCRESAEWKATMLYAARELLDLRKMLTVPAHIFQGEPNYRSRP